MKEAKRLRLVGILFGSRPITIGVFPGHRLARKAATRASPVKTQTYRRFGIADDEESGFANSRARLRVYRELKQSRADPANRGIGPGGIVSLAAQPL